MSIRVLHITGDSRWGGGGAIILALARMARRNGWEADMLTTDPVCREVMSDSGVGIVPLDVIWRDIRLFRDLGGLVRLYRFLKRARYDVVHTHTSKAGFVGRIAARLAGIPVIIHTVHSFPFHEESSREARLIYCSLEKCAAHFCDRIVTVSHYHRRLGISMKVAHADRIVAIPNGIADIRSAVHSSREAVQESLGINPNELFLFTPGRLSAGKGLEYLIEAIPILSRGVDRPFRVVLAGSGELKQRLEQKAVQLGCREKLLFLGFRRDIGDLLNACDMVLLPSLHEGMSISLLEAMSAGKPIVATAIGGHLEPAANGEGALMVPVKTPAAMADAVLKLVNSPEVATRLARKGRELYEQHYTSEIMMQSYNELYRDLIVSACVHHREAHAAHATGERRI